MTCVASTAAALRASIALSSRVRRSQMDVSVIRVPGARTSWLCARCTARLSLMLIAQCADTKRSVTRRGGPPMRRLALIPLGTPQNAPELHDPEYLPHVGQITTNSTRRSSIHPVFRIGTYTAEYVGCRDHEAKEASDG